MKEIGECYCFCGIYGEIVLPILMSAERFSKKLEEEQREMKAISLRYKDTYLLVHKSLALSSINAQDSSATVNGQGSSVTKENNSVVDQQTFDEATPRYNVDISESVQKSTVCTLSWLQGSI